MKLRQLQYFLVAAEELHFGRAAERLHITQPPLSRQIRELEEDLGVELFDRSRRKIRLTEAGEVFQQEAERVIQRAESAKARMQRIGEGRAGTLSIGFVGSVATWLLPRVLRTFHEQFPLVDLTLREMNTDHQLAALQAEQIDVGFIREYSPKAGLEGFKLHAEPFVLALPERHPLARHDAVDLSDCAGEHFIMVPRAVASSFHDHIIAICAEAGFSPRITQEAGHFSTHLGMVATGLGIALLPESAAVFDSGGVMTRPLLQEPTTAISLYWKKDSRSKILRRFVDCVRAIEHSG